MYFESPIANVPSYSLGGLCVLGVSMFSESLTKALRGKILDRPHSPSLSPALAEDFDGSGVDRGERGQSLMPRPRAAVAKLLRPGLHSVALTGPKAPAASGIPENPLCPAGHMGHAPLVLTGREM